MHKDVERFVSIVDFLGEVLGSNTEIILHDLTNLESSVVHIVNGYISNRKVGDSITDFMLESISKNSEDNKKFICRYSSKTVDGKLLHSSTYFIRDEKDEIVGLVGINSDYDEVKKSMSFLTSLFPNYIDDKTISLNVIKENLSSNPKEITLNKVDEILGQFDVAPDRMNTAEKTQIISTLNECGVFSIRGSVQEVASKLHMSEPSVYRYLNKIKKESK